MKPSQYFSITATSKYPREAASFIDFFTNNIEANKSWPVNAACPSTPRWPRRSSRC